jgi:hypothetical protein
LQKSLTNEQDLFVEAYPVFENNNAKPKRKSTFLICAVMQDEYNKKALFPEQYKEQQAQYARGQIQILPYIHGSYAKKQ